MPPNPTPTALKVLRGTDKHNPQRINRDEPKPTLGARAPTWLPKKGVAWSTWIRHVTQLNRVRVLTEVDANALAMGCLALEEYLIHREAGNWKQADICARRYLAVLIQFGMTPSSRTKVRSEPAPAVDPLKEWEATR